MPSTFINRFRDVPVRTQTLVLLALFLPFDLSKSFMFDLSHIGGAFGLTISAVDCFVVALLVILSVERGRRQPPSHAVLFALFFYLGALVLSTYFADSPRFALFELVRIAKALLLACVTYYATRTEVDFRIVAAAIATSVSIQAIIGVTTYAAGRSSFGFWMFHEQQTQFQQMLADRDLLRAASPVGHPNVLASFLVLGSPFLWCAAAVRKGWRRLLPAGASIVCVWALLLTYSRGGWIGLVGAAVMFALLAPRNLGVLRPRIRTVLVVTGVSLAVLWPILPTVTERATEGMTSGDSVRVALMDAADDMIRQHPVTGIGLNNFTIVLPQYDPDGVARTFRVTGEDYWPVHNLPLLIASETGVLGLCAWCGLVLSILLVARPKAATGWLNQAWAAALISGISGFLMHNLLDWTYAQVTPLPFFWMIMGLLLAIPTLGSRRAPGSMPQRRFSSPDLTGRRTNLSGSMVGSRPPGI